MSNADTTSFLTNLASATEEHLRRLNNRLRGSGKALDIQIEVGEKGENCFLQIKTKDGHGDSLIPGEIASLIIPQPRQDQHGNWLIGDRSSRALCPLMVVVGGQARHVSYFQMVAFLLFENLEEMFPTQGQRSHMDRILWGMYTKRGRLSASLCQRFLNSELFNMFPLSGTPMQDWAMNRRLMIFDPRFESLRPDEKLEYQRRKNELLYPWTSIGISDGAAAVRNYILQADLKEYTAFGGRHHNRIRNLYSTLGMKGDEAGLVISEGMSTLEKSGIFRGGWNWMTVFLDVPLNFEDQILVSVRHADKQVSYSRSFVVFGLATASVGQIVKTGHSLGQNEDESEVIFDIPCDHAVVESVEDSVVPFDGLDEPVMVVSLKVFYTLKEGVKITNQHGNKGIIRLMDLGMVHDPKRGDIPIDVVVSAKSIQKRKNFGQVLEAWLTLIHGNEKRHIIPDKLETSAEKVRAGLEKSGYSSEGTCPVTTPWGSFETICGWVHWGVTKTPEEQLWRGQDVWREDQRGIRTRGNKMSPVELRSLTTLLGPKNAVTSEILSYQQGVSEVQQLLDTVKGMRGEYLSNLPVVDPEQFCYLPSGMGTFYGKQNLFGTVSDENMYPGGCYLQLPFTLQIVLPNDPRAEVSELIANRNAYEHGEDCRIFETDRLMVPSADLRQPWLHPTGKYGLTDLASMLNQVLEALSRLKLKEVKETQVSALVFRYWHYVSKVLSTKTGKISTYLMSVRYPWSAKATATLGSNLEENWIEIHTDMARDLKVSDGDYVLVERFPCLGFMSMRIQRVKLTVDPQCKYVVRVSGNSLVSMNLDFDGDVIYVMSFHTEKAKEELKKNFHEPHPRIAEVLQQLNERKKPMTRAMNISELGLLSFPDMSPQEHADLSARSLAVKIYTGPVIALCYDLMRIVEAGVPYQERNTHILVEAFLDKVGNSVFSQKHGNRSLREECIEAICLADPSALVKLGFPEQESAQLCQIIRDRAAKIGVDSDERLREAYEAYLRGERSNIIKILVRRNHKAYFATRANLYPLRLLEHLNTEPIDLVGHLIHRSLSDSE